MRERDPAPRPAAEGGRATGGREGAPILIQGIRPRSGTNYLLNLLCLHPDCGPPAPIWEDDLLTHVRHLDAYADAVWRSWDPAWGVDPSARGRLVRALGDGLCCFLRESASAPRVVTKTPRVEGLMRLPELIPDAFLLILVRDGRAVVESGVRSFGWYRDGAIRAWRDGARAILAFDAAHRGGPFRYRIVRYEDLVSHPEKTLRDLLAFIELDPDRYDFEQVSSLPVLGSSDLAGSGGRIDWQGRLATREFDPLGRARGWSPRRHARFEWVAGDAARALGYAPSAPGRSGLPNAVWNVAMDLRHLAIRSARPVWRRWRRWRARRIAPA